MGTLIAPSAVGGVNWPGGAVDPVDDVLFVASQTSLFRAQVVAGSAEYRSSVSQPSRSSRRAAVDCLRLPLIKPPYGRITAVDLKTGERLWMVPHGDTPEAIKKNPKLQGVEIPNTGTPTMGTGLLVTSTLLLGGQGGATRFFARGTRRPARSSRRSSYPVRPPDSPSPIRKQGGSTSPWRHGLAMRGDRGSRASGCDGTRRPSTTVTRDMRPLGLARHRPGGNSIMKTARLRAIPSVDRILQSLGETGFPAPVVVDAVRRHLQVLRSQKTIPGADAIVADIRSGLERLRASRIVPVINATGVLVHTNLGRAPLAADSIRALTDIGASYNTLEYS
jgi:hypothetical protein